MKQEDWTDVSPDLVLDFWFPDDGHETSPETHREFWTWRMRGGADEAICERFADLTLAAAKGFLDHWAATPRGRLALIIALDQFPRSLWRGTPAAYGQDIKSARLALEAFDNGDYDALGHPWEKQFLIVCVSHCEGPDHLARMDRLVAMSKVLAASVPEHLKTSYMRTITQSQRVRGIVARFGRHPHRNAILGRVSTADEEEYIAIGEFPHESEIPEVAQ
jgi:uncharacterized protein (DUF924 family)